MMLSFKRPHSQGADHSARMAFHLNYFLKRMNRLLLCCSGMLCVICVFMYMSKICVYMYVNIQHNDMIVIIIIRISSSSSSSNSSGSGGSGGSSSSSSSSIMTIHIS